MPSQSPLLSLLLELRKNPCLYIGIPSVRNLAFFLRGYLLGAERHGVSQPDLFLNRFQTWIQKHFDMQGTQGWEKVIAFYSFDERSAFDDFWKLLDLFLESSNSSATH